MNMVLMCLKRSATGVLTFAGLSCVAGCAVDLGTCDPTLGSMTPSGADIVTEYCSGGRCHSGGAIGKQRHGVPAGLNFDPGTDAGLNEIRDNSHEMWAQVDADEMPPKGAGARMSAAETNHLRNWLACGAPASGTAPTTADWTSIYALFSMKCLGCHSTAAAAAAGGDFAMGNGSSDACGAFAKVVGKVSVTPTCTGMARTLVVAGQPDDSLLVQKIEGKQMCGASMPLGSMPLAQTDPDTVQKIRAWITAGAIKPATCP